MPEVPGFPGANGTGIALIAALNGDAPFMVRIGPSDFAADLEAALESLDPARCAVIRIGNPLNTPLTPRRVMLQLAPDSEEAAGSDGADRLLRTVADRAAGRPSLLIVVEQAETLTPAALALLQLLPGLRGPTTPAVRVAFHGAPVFRTLLRDPRFRQIRDHDDAPPPPLSRRPLERSRRGAALGVASVVVAVLLAAPLLLLRGPSPIATVPAAPTSPPFLSSAANASPVPATLPAPPRSIAEDLAVVPPNNAPRLTSPAEASPSTPKPPAAVAEEPAAARARLYREFNAFVETRGLAGRLSLPDREALFREYLARRYASTAPVAPNLRPPTSSTPASAAATLPDPGPASPPGPEVVLFFPAGLPGAQARAGEDATLLRQHATNVVLRPAPDGPAQPTIRYFRAGDRTLAITIALALPPTTPDWQVVDLSGAADRPVRPTIEVWLPGTP